MIKVIGVRFRTAGKIYFFDPLSFEIKRGDHVIVETARGIEFGTVMTGVTEVEDEKVVQPLKPVIRIANQRDIEQEAANKAREKEAFRVCLEKIHKHELDMKLIDAEYTFDNNKVLFYFTADGRIDFRELVKDLAGVFKTRIELRQIGVRDETKLVGGIGICGRPLCCHSYLSDFVPVSIKMAKEQNLSLNPTKISGVCGRLMCCLKNEEETYEELNRRLPGIGDFVTSEDGLRGEVHSVNVLRQLVKVVVDAGDTKEIKEYPVEKLQFRRRHSKKERMELSKEELAELERLEEEERLRHEEEGQQRQNRSEEQRQNGGRNRQDFERQQNADRRQGGRSRQDNGRRQDNRDRQSRNDSQNQSGEQRQNRSDSQNRNGEQRQNRNDSQNQSGEQRQNRNDSQNRNGEQRQSRSDSQNQSGEQRQNRNDSQNQSGEQRQSRSDSQNQSREQRQNRSDSQNQSGEQRQNRSDSQNRNGEQRQNRSDSQNQSREQRQDGGRNRNNKYRNNGNNRGRQEGQPKRDDS